MTDRPDPLADEEAAEAAREARAIGGRPTRDLEPGMPHDPAMDPVYEAGGGEAEGFEMAEDELIEHSELGPSRPESGVRVREEADAEDEAPDAAAYGEADREAVSEDRDDPDAR